MLRVHAHSLARCDSEGIWIEDIDALNETAKSRKRGYTHTHSAIDFPPHHSRYAGYAVVVGGGVSRAHKRVSIVR